MSVTLFLGATASPSGVETLLSFCRTARQRVKNGRAEHKRRRHDQAKPVLSKSGDGARQRISKGGRRRRFPSGGKERASRIRSSGGSLSTAGVTVHVFDDIARRHLVARKSAGCAALRQRNATLPGVSFPSSVVRRGRVGVSMMMRLQLVCPTNTVTVPDRKPLAATAGATSCVISWVPLPLVETGNSRSETYRGGHAYV